jgi:hypothetical protein
MRHPILLGSAVRSNPLQSTTRHLLRHSQLSSPRLQRLALPRSYSSSLSPKQQQQQPPTTTTTATTPLLQNHTLAPTAANPPSTTRPPPLTLPTRPPPNAPALSKPKYYLALGLAFLKFYKTGLKHIITNTRLLYTSKPIPDGPARPYEGTRAHLHLRLRWAHDVRRLPFFALVLLVCGEFTPFVVLLMPRAVPGTCRVPRQADKLLQEQERLRVEGRGEVAALGGGQQQVPQAPDGAMAKILGVRVGRLTPGWVLRPRVLRRLRFLGVDDALLVQAGGAEALVEVAVRLACVLRGFAGLGRGERELRAVLGKWLRLTDARRLGEEGSEKAVVRLLLTKEAEWGA